MNREKYEILFPMILRQIFKKGLQYFQKTQYPGAIRKFRDAIFLKPKSIEAHNLLVRSHLEKYREVSKTGQVDVDITDIDESIKSFQNVIQLNPKDAEAFFDLGRVLSVKGQEKDAIDTIKSAIDLDPSNSVYKLFIWHLFSQN